jgi:hypothetical protein
LPRATPTRPSSTIAAEEPNHVVPPPQQGKQPGADEDPAREVEATRPSGEKSRTEAEREEQHGLDRARRDRPEQNHEAGTDTVCECGRRNQPFGDLAVAVAQECGHDDQQRHHGQAAGGDESAHTRIQERVRADGTRLAFAHGSDQGHASPTLRSLKRRLDGVLGVG